MKNCLMILCLFAGIISQAQVNTFDHLMRHKECLLSNDWHAIKQLSDAGYVFCRSTEDLSQGASIPILQMEFTFIRYRPTRNGSRKS